MQSHLIAQEALEPVPQTYKSERAREIDDMKTSSLVVADATAAIAVADTIAASTAQPGDTDSHSLQ